MRRLSQASWWTQLLRDPKILRQLVEQVHRQFAACASGGELTHSSQESQVHQIQSDAGLLDMVALSQQVTQLQRSVTVIHEQLTGYMLEAIRERQRTIEERLNLLEAAAVPGLPGGSGVPAMPQIRQESSPIACTVPDQHILPVEQRIRSRMHPLIQYEQQGSYASICPCRGRLLFAPDSTEWFDWLASLISFRFVGQHGHFLAHCASEDGERTRGWRAYCRIQQRSYRRYLGTTDRLTVAHLEEVAALLQA